ncbi:protease [Phormidesmis priestleyi ULC007]|uniref:Protease n=2 Tax=Phormidesmis priestleyi TaxID=268141 RepID=A0A2T1D4E0_9CYAN|nr:protease [Phormidesmis priestleyi ULC007]
MTPQTTGKYLILFREDSVAEGVQLLSETFTTSSSDTLTFGELGVAVVAVDPTQLSSLNIASPDSPILAVEPEQVLYALQDVTPEGAIVSVSVDYLRGYRDAVTTLSDSLISSDQSQAEAVIDESAVTWGLQATEVTQSKYSGAGIKVAVLDTGFDLTHPDFLGRNVTAKSFVEGQDVQDGNGHGTHCIGTACGSKTPGVLPLYGIAYNAEIYAGKVLSNEGSGTDSQILQGIEWAIANGCDIISMSLGAATQPGQSYSRIYEAIAKRALKRGTLIVAAAGNESNRSAGIIRPVGRPANCPSILAVAAIDVQLQVASFSTQGINPKGGQIDIAAPGVKVRSSWILPLHYRTISGTSMATPHVAGIAALHAEATGLRGQELWNLLAKSAQRLPLPSVDVGAGLVQAP